VVRTRTFKTGYYGPDDCVRETPDDVAPTSS